MSRKVKTRHEASGDPDPVPIDDTPIHDLPGLLDGHLLNESSAFRQLDYDPSHLRNLISTKLNEKENLGKLHKVMGHNTGKVIEMLRAAKVGQKVIDDYKKICASCPACREHASKPRIPRAGGHFATDVNQIHCTDLFDVHFKMSDKTFVKKTYMHVVDMFSKMQFVYECPDYESSTAAEAFLDIWRQTGGPPSRLLSDNDSAFKGVTKFWLQRYDVIREPTIANSPHQNGLCERHGGWLKVIIKRTWAECQAAMQSWNKDFPGEKIVLTPTMIVSAAVLAKNSMPTSLGFSPQKLMFGRDHGLGTRSFDDNRKKLEDPQNYGSWVAAHEAVMSIAKRIALEVASCQAIRSALLRTSHNADGHTAFQPGDRIVTTLIVLVMPTLDGSVLVLSTLWKTKS